MDINRANLEIFFEDLRVQFTEGFNSGMETSVLDNLAMTVPSTSSTMVHAWLNQIPKMREWVGDRVVNNIESNSLTIKNKKYESTIEMPREDIEDDNHGLYLPLARLMGSDAAMYRDELLVDALVAGTSDTWADDVEFFSTAGRTFGSNTINNYSTDALSATSFNTAYQAMTSYLGHNDKPLKVRPAYLLYGPSNRTTAFDILQNDFIAGSSVQIQNVNKGVVTPIESARLVGSDAAKWYLMGDIAGLKGVVWQNRKDAEFQTSRLSDDSDFVFEQDKYQFGTRARGRAFLSLPFLVFGNHA